MKTLLRGRSIWTLHSLAAAGILGVGGLCVGVSRSSVAGALRRGETVVGLALGTDLAENAPHSDTLMVALYRPREGRLDVLSIPRDTKIDLPGYRFHRINEVFAYHYRQGRDVHLAARRVGEAVAHLFSVAGSTVVPTHYVQIDFDGFRRMIDRLGGVTLTVDEPMDYDDNAGRFHVHLATGVHHLTGEEALGYVRFRGKSGDRGRILRQMEFLRALGRRLASPEMVWRAPRAAAELFASVRTDLSALDVVVCALEARRLTASGINTVLLPGRPRGAAWEMDRERAGYILAKLEGRDVAAVFPGPEQGSEGDREDVAPPRRVTVKVWNASGRAGRAIEVARFLRSKGFDVVEWGNYKGRQRKSRVIDRSGRFEQARAVAETLGVTSLYSDADPGLRTDADVVLGEDFQGAETWK